jgi:hypothetical protein
LLRPEQYFFPPALSDITFHHLYFAATTHPHNEEYPMTSSEENFLKVMTDGFKTLTIQLIAYKQAIEAFRESHPEDASIIDAAQIDAVNSPELRDIVHQRFDVALEQFFKQAPASLSLSEVTALLQTMLRKRPKN